MPVLLQRFQDKVREMMILRDMNQSDLARDMGVGRMVVSRYLTGRNSPRFETVEMFAKALGVDPGDLLDESPIAEKVAS